MKQSRTDAAIKWRAILFILLVFALIGLVIAWRWSSMSRWLDIELIVDELRHFAAGLNFLSAVAYVALACVAAMPLGVVLILSALAFGSWLGAVYSICGALIGAGCSYGIGAFLGHEAMCRFAGPRINNVSACLAKRGLAAVVVIRLLPIAPFAVVNMVAGASHIRLVDFMFGTLLGMLPSAFIIGAFVDQIKFVLSAPGYLKLAALSGLALLVVGGWWLGRRWWRRQPAPPGRATSE